MAHRVSPRALDKLSDIWLYVLDDRQSVEAANRLIFSITSRFALLAKHPYLGRARDHDLGGGMRTLPVGEYVIVYCVERGGVEVLRVVHGRRDFAKLFGE